jgi:AcrR family transcriptional regulator
VITSSTATAGTARKRPTGRRGGDSGTRDAILLAARTLFAAKGYTGASLRAIAAEAGVDPALIRHFFGDKDGLFAATLEFAIDIPRRFHEVVEGDRAGLGARFTDMYLRLWEDPQTGHVLQALFRSAVTSDQAAGMLREFVGARVLHSVVPALGGDDAARRVTVAAAHLIGVAIARHVVRVEPLAGMPRDQVVALVAPAIQAYLAGPLPPGAGSDAGGRADGGAGGASRAGTGGAAASG